jgi:transposase
VRIVPNCCSYSDGWIAAVKVSVASVVKWSQRFRATGSAAARPVGGNRPYVLSSERAWLLKRLAEQPDVTFRALLAELAERGIKVSYYAVWHFFEHEGISFKKKACTPANRIVPT